MAAANSLLALDDHQGYDVFYAVLTGKRKSGQGLIKEQLDQFKNPRRVAEFGFYAGIGFLPYASYGVGAVQDLHRNGASPVRATAAAAIATDPDPLTAKALTDALADKNWVVRAAALKAISKRGDPALLPQAQAAMADKKDVVRYTAAAAVLHLSHTTTKAD